MDILKDITDGLRGDGRTRQNGESDAATNSETVATTSGDGDDRSPSVPTGSAGRSDDGAERGDETDRNGDGAHGPDRDDEHVCSFCRTTFDADRGTCPECDAEIVLRGGR